MLRNTSEMGVLCSQVILFYVEVLKTVPVCKEAFNIFKNILPWIFRGIALSRLLWARAPASLETLSLYVLQASSAANLKLVEVIKRSWSPQSTRTEAREQSINFVY